MTKRFFTTSLPAGQHSNGEVLNNANKEMLNNLTNGYGIPGFYPGTTKQHLETVDISPYFKGVDPFSRISNISSSFVEINEYNELMSKHGLNKRGSSQLHLITKGEHNKDMQQYLTHTKAVLTDLRSDPEQY